MGGGGGGGGQVGTESTGFASVTSRAAPGRT